MVQSLRLLSPSAGDPGSIPGQGTRSHMLQLRAHMLQLKLLCATTCCLKKKKKKQPKETLVGGAME